MDNTNLVYLNIEDMQYIYTQMNNVENINDLIVHFLNNVLNVDEGNFDALFELFLTTLNINYLEKSLKYAKDFNEQQIYIKKYVSSTIKIINAPFIEIIKYVPKDNEELYKYGIRERYNFLFEEASKVKYDKEKIISELKWLANQMLLKDTNNFKLIFEIFKFELGCITDNDLINYSIPLEQLKSYTDVLPNLNDYYQSLLLDIVDKQERRIEKENQRLKEEREKALEEQRIRELDAREEKKRLDSIRKKERTTNIFITVSSILSILTISIFCTSAIFSDSESGFYFGRKILIEKYTSHILLILGLIILIKICIYIIGFICKVKIFKKTYDITIIYLSIVSIISLVVYILNDKMIININDIYIGSLKLILYPEHVLFYLGITLGAINIIIALFDKGIELEIYRNQKNNKGIELEIHRNQKNNKGIMKKIFVIINCGLTILSLLIFK